MSSKTEPSLKSRALRHLARREYTRHELALKLAPHAESEAEIAQVLDDFTQQGWLSEQRAAEQIARVRRSRYGMARIRHDLQTKGVSAAVVGTTLVGLKDTELDAARAVWRRKFREVPVNATERAKQARFLQNRGFSSEIITRLLRGLSRGDIGEE